MRHHFRIVPEETGDTCDDKMNESKVRSWSTTNTESRKEDDPERRVLVEPLCVISAAGKLGAGTRTISYPNTGRTALLLLCA